MPNSPSVGIEGNLNFLFGEESGWVYLPIKVRSGEFQSKEHFFEWPRQRSEIVAHVTKNADIGNVYIGPALHSSRANALISNVRGSNVVWVDIDGDPPSAQDLKRGKIPTPSLIIESSPGHQHWYWKLDAFETDLPTLQGINKALAYSLENADLSGWDANQVLRPVGSVNHKRNEAVTNVLSFSERTYNVADFAAVPVPAKIHFDEAAFKAMGRVAPIRKTIHKYVWTDQEQNVLYRRPKPGETLDGRRGTLLFKLGCLCAEKGMPDSDIYSIVSGVDAQPWFRKFADRPNVELCYIRLIDKVRQEIPYRSEADKLSGFERVTFLQHFEEDIKVEFILEGLLAPTSLNFIMGKSGSGKTMMAHAIFRSLATCTDLMHWKNNSKQALKTLYFSYEMNKLENIMRYDEWRKNYTEAEIRLIEDNFITLYPGDNPPKFWVLADQARIQTTIEVERPAGILIDSASMSIAPEMTDEEAAKRSIEFLRALIKRYNIFVFVIHHPRKDPAGTKSKDYDVDGTHGAQVIINQATTAMNINRIFEDDTMVGEDDSMENLKINVTWRKWRLGPWPPQFQAEIQPDLMFKLRNPIGELPKGKPEPKALPAARTAPVQDTLTKLGEGAKNNGNKRTPRRSTKSDEF